MRSRIVGLTSIAALLLVGCSNAKTEPMLVLNFDEQPLSAVTVLYEEDGESFSDTIEPDSTGTYCYTPNLIGNNTDVMIIIGYDFYGAHISKGKTVHATIGQEVAFAGDNVERSRFFNAYSHAYNPYRYKPSPSDTIYDPEMYMAMLNEGHEKAHTLADAITNKEELESLRRMNDASRDYYMMQIMSIDGYTNHADHRDEMDAILAKVDPNSDEARLSGMLLKWYDQSDLHRNGANDLTIYMIEQIMGVDSILENKANAKYLALTLGSMFFGYEPGKDEIERFMNGVEPYLAREERVKNTFQEYIDKLNSRIGDGSPLPTDPTLIAPDGCQVKLSELLGDKHVYIDIWATWCVPCCREIPHMEKLVEKYKGNDKVAFISISCDDDLVAWNKKLNADKPQWPQYVFDKKSGDEFMEAMSISGIPRFLFIGPDSRLVKADAARPSSDEIHKTIDQAIGL